MKIKCPPKGFMAFVKVRVSRACQTNAEKLRPFFLQNGWSDVRLINIKQKIFASRHNSGITFVAEMLDGTINIFYFLSLHRSSKSVIECISCKEYYTGD